VDQTGSDALTSVRAQDADQREQSQRDKAAKIGVSVGWPIKSTAVEQGPFEARWLQSSAASGSNSMHVELVIERHVRVGEHEVIQGVWLDWPALEAHLRSVIEDLLPVASLRPRARVNEPSSQDRWLAAIPAVIEPGAMPVVKPDGWSATRTTLLATWFAVLAAIGAIGWVLRSSMELSDRRGRFVSAVTHELRTPLTTFQLYTDMLASGMVDPASRDSYLKTLQGESARLSRLVENVLVFSRLSEGARPGGATEPVGELGAMLACVEPILQARAQQSGMRVEIIGDPDGARVRCDEASLERLLFNLVENSAKYAEGRERGADRSAGRRRGGPGRGPDRCAGLWAGCAEGRTGEGVRGVLPIGPRQRRSESGHGAGLGACTGAGAAARRRCAIGGCGWAWGVFSSDLAARGGLTRRIEMGG
jgi:signal transduction histidine kinase